MESKRKDLLQQIDEAASQYGSYNHNSPKLKINLNAGKKNIEQLKKLTKKFTAQQSSSFIPKEYL